MHKSLECLGKEGDAFSRAMLTGGRLEIRVGGRLQIARSALPTLLYPPNIPGGSPNTLKHILRVYGGGNGSCRGGKTYIAQVEVCCTSGTALDRICSSLPAATAIVITIAVTQVCVWGNEIMIRGTIRVEICKTLMCRISNPPPQYYKATKHLH